MVMVQFEWGGGDSERTNDEVSQPGNGKNASNFFILVLLWWLLGSFFLK